MGLNEFGIESKILRDIDIYIPFSDDCNCIIMPAVIENYTDEKIKPHQRHVRLETSVTSLLAATLTRKMHIS
ncbi:MAG: hypothetical protein WAK43_02510, partial [Dehalococcoidales bacterium]